jgi:hypothetical protein
MDYFTGLSCKNGTKCHIIGLTKEVRKKGENEDTVDRKSRRNDKNKIKEP